MSMKREDISPIKLMFAKYGFKLLGSDGSCACGNAEIFGVTIETHCYKSGCESGHEYACVHVSADIYGEYTLGEIDDIANHIAKEIHDSYMCEVDVEASLI